MRSLLISSSSPVLLSFALFGCGGDGAESSVPAGVPSSEAASLAGEAAASGSEDGTTANSEGEAQSSNSDSAAGEPVVGEGGEGVDTELNLDATEQTDAPGVDESPAVQAPIADGRLVDGACLAICQSDATDPDGDGVRDGWGFENGESCLVAGLEPQEGREVCDFGDDGVSGLPGPPLEPLTPVAEPGETVIRPEGVESEGFFVSGGRLFDRQGNDFVMRGVNNPLVWFQNRNNGAFQWLEEIASTGANTVRLVWEIQANDNLTLLRDAIARTVELNMVPMVEMHDETGGRDVNGPALMAQYYVDNTLDMFEEFEETLLVNIANEWDGADNIYVEAYTTAINILRDAGVNHTLVIDANGYGQGAPTVIREGQALLAADPQHNLLFSAHMYENFRNAQTIRDTLARAVEAQIPFIVGEFGFQHGGGNNGPIQIPFEVLLEESERLGLGYLAWSWNGNSGGVEYLDLTAAGSADQLTAWGDDIVNGPNGIRQTSEPASIFLQ